MNNDKYFLIVPASGVGKRMESTTPKQYLRLENGLTIIDQCLKTILEINSISGFVVALSNTDSFLPAKHHSPLTKNKPKPWILVATEDKLRNSIDFILISQ